MAKNYNRRIKRKYYNITNNDDFKCYKLSSLINSSHELFAEFVQSAYFITDFICKDYPNYFEWYWTKEIPRIFNYTGEIIICTINNDIAGVAFLKKDYTECKICTLLVVEKYRGKHVATRILKIAFKYLGTTKPLITISENKLPLFKYIIKKYNWKLTQVMSKGYYNNTYREYVYNGKLSE